MKKDSESFKDLMKGESVKDDLYLIILIIVLAAIAFVIF